MVFYKCLRIVHLLLLAGSAFMAAGCGQSTTFAIHGLNMDKCPLGLKLVVQAGSNKIESPLIETKKRFTWPKRELTQEEFDFFVSDDSTEKIKAGTPLLVEAWCYESAGKTGYIQIKGQISKNRTYVFVSDPGITTLTCDEGAVQRIDPAPCVSIKTYK